MSNGFKAIFIETSYKRIIGSLKARTQSTLRSPPISELEFIKLTSNHGEYAKKLKSLGLEHAAHDIQSYSRYVGWRWLLLAKDHIRDARAAFVSGCERSTFSRSYYAAYNASKAVRYTIAGSVSMKGDDHGKASSDLPDDFPKVDEWSATIVSLYEHRLKADYDNWTSLSFALTSEEALRRANSFIIAAEEYLADKMARND